MCQQAKNIKRFGVANPTKEERHRLCKKDSTTDEESSTSSCLDDAGKSIKNYQQQVSSIFFKSVIIKLYLHIYSIVIPLYMFCEICNIM